MFKELFTESYTGEPNISYADYGKAVSDAQKRANDLLLNVSKKLKGLGILTYSGTYTTLTLYRNKEGQIIEVARDSRDGEIEVILKRKPGSSGYRFEIREISVDEVKEALSKVKKRIDELNEEGYNIHFKELKKIR